MTVSLAICVFAIVANGSDLESNGSDLESTAAAVSGSESSYTPQSVVSELREKVETLSHALTFPTAWHEIKTHAPLSLFSLTDRSMSCTCT